MAFHNFADVLRTIVLFCFQDATAYQAEKEVVPNLKPWSLKDCQSYQSPPSTMANFGERKEKCRFSGLAE